MGLVFTDPKDVAYSFRLTAEEVRQAKFERNDNGIIVKWRSKKFEIGLEEKEGNEAMAAIRLLQSAK